ncbi:MAG: PglZ domain-containing protein [Desulfobacterium sp.]|nr:PglZ domain-containing protein [Aliarcobacter skirrowii]MDD2509466.1 PglZ domain-containing protein [Aliarcobacter skirrowii]MDY0222813.1 PglZ domain-containing protein [Desulfobacterium sp.]
MIEIYCDQYGLHDADNINTIVSEPSEYEDALLKIKSHASKNEPLQVIVRNPAMFDWFDAAVKYGAQKKMLDPVSTLMSTLQRSATPQYLKANPHWIVELGLISKAKEEPIGQESVEAWLKRVLLGKVWNETYPASVDNLSELFNFFINHREGLLHSLEEHLIYERLEYWSSKGYELFTWLRINPFKRVRFVVWEQLLSAFPEEKISIWFQQDHIWFELSQFSNRHNLHRIPLNLQLPENIAVCVRTFLLQEWEKSAETALSFISGNLDFERKFLLERLQDQLHREEPITQDIFNKLKTFEKFPEVITLARQLVSVKTPSIPSSTDSVDEIRNWIADEYLPFYASSSLLGQLEATIPYLEAFERWLTQHYTGLLFGDEMAYRQTAKLKASIVEGDPVLIVVFDGLDYLSAQDVLLPFMQKNGLFPLNETMPFFAFLPTQTYVAKPALVSGKMNSQISDEIPTAIFYKELLLKQLGLSEEEIIVKTDKESTLLEQIQKIAQVYLYLDNHLDTELLHKAFRPYIRKKKYDEYIRKQAEEIFQCMKSFKEMYGKSLQVVISSDHGYTLIPKNAPVIEIAEVKDVKNRTVYATDIVDADNDGLDEKNIWRLNSDLYGLSREMIIPRGYACFNKRPLGATHGGCSPQEMAVPWIFLSEERPLAPVALSFSFEGEIFRKRPENSIVLNILNPNDYRILIVEMVITGLNTIDMLPLSIGKKDGVKFDLTFNASTIVDRNVGFSVRYLFKSYAGEREDTLIITVPTTGAMTTEFDDDFDF